MRRNIGALADLFAGTAPGAGGIKILAPGAALLRGFVQASLPALLREIEHVATVMRSAIACDRRPPVRVK